MFLQYNCDRIAPIRIGRIRVKRNRCTLVENRERFRLLMKNDSKRSVRLQTVFTNSFINRVHLLKYWEKKNQYERLKQFCFTVTKRLEGLKIVLRPERIILNTTQNVR